MNEAMTFDLARMLESKAAMRRKLAVLPIEAKFQILDELREAALDFAEARPTPSTSPKVRAALRARQEWRQNSPAVDAAAMQA